MERYQAGDADAFDRLFAALAPALGGFLRRMGPAGIDVDDLVQNTFLQLHRARHTYLPGRPLKPWVYAIARHVALMARRSRSRSTAKETPIEERSQELAEPRGGLSETIDRLTLERLLDVLPDAGREALWLHHVEGLSFREVASVLGIRETAAKVRAHRALAALRTRLATGGAP